MRIARILAILLALLTLGVSIYFGQQLPPSDYLHLLPANLGATGSLIFWIKAPAKKKARRRAALASLAVVFFIFGTAVLAYLGSPVQDWPVFVSLSALAAMVAIWAIIRVKRKANHPWADYYREVA